ncbi:flavin reductase family protein [Streptomyces malaysiensis]|uniref:flavin reductase family protein n=1 Tax=Streptomyces malaysiensis TaxID=92644 RepID=UPI002B2C1416|nr:flavin reductase family protein [Streptomyces malaysiensis]
MSHQIANRDVGRTIDEREFRTAMSRFASGLTIVAGLDKRGEPAGLTCQSFSSLSIEPPLILVCIGLGSGSWAQIEPTGRFGVSILAEEQKDICAALGRRAEDKFSSIPWRASPTGAVHIDGALATIDCRISAIHEAGDHIVVIGEVTDLSMREGGTPLLFFGGSFGKGAF